MDHVGRTNFRQQNISGGQPVQAGGDAGQLFPGDYAPVEDTFVGSGKLRTSGKAVDIFVDKAGVLFQKITGHYWPVGQLEADGSFRLGMGRSIHHGNIFNDTVFDLPAKKIRGPMGEWFRSLERQWAIQSSEIPFIRHHLTMHGIDGRGVSVAVLERGGKEGPSDEETVVIKDHAKLVRAVIKNPRWGYAPGADTRILLSKPDEPKKIRDSLPGFKQQSLEKIRDFMYLDHLVQFTGNPQAPRIINISNGTSITEIAEMLDSSLAEKNEPGVYAYPELRRAILGPDAKKYSPKQRLERVLAFLDQMLQEPEFQQLFEEYRNVTRQLAEQGTFVVVAAGNNQDRFPPDIRKPPGFGYNFLAQSDWVIPVAAADNNATPGDTRDDRVTPFSSHGNGTRWNPAVTATGERVWLDIYSDRGNNGDFAGTSCATPVVASTLAMMLQVNPALDFQQAKHILQSTATNTAAPIAMEGAGMLNPVWAVWRAAGWV